MEEGSKHPCFMLYSRSAEYKRPGFLDAASQNRHAKVHSKAGDPCWRSCARPVTTRTFERRTPPTRVFRVGFFFGKFGSVTSRSEGRATGTSIMPQIPVG